MESNETEETTDAVTLAGADGLKTVTIGSNGQVYLGQDLEGESVKVAWRVNESTDRDAEDTES